MDTEHIKKVYRRYSEIYDLLFKGFFYSPIKRAIDLTDIQPGERILEVGIGTGLSLLAYPPYCEVVGVDISQPMLKQAEKKVKRHKLRNVILREMDASNLEFEDGSFDSVTAFFVITVVPDPVKIIGEMRRVLKKKGKIIIVNHFLSKNPFLAKIEGFVSPLCEKMGWRSDLDLKHLIAQTNLEVHRQFQANKLWKIILAENGE